MLSLSVEGGVEAVSGSGMSLRAESLSVESSVMASVSTVDGVLRAWASRELRPAGFEPARTD